MRPCVRLASCLLAASLAAACRSEPKEGPKDVAAAAPVPSAPTAPDAGAAQKPEPKSAFRPPYNVLLLMIDSLRADMPWAGYPRDVAPRLTALAKQWVVYPRAYSLSSYTAKSVVPALAGMYPSEMPRDAFFFTRWPEENLLLSEVARDAGVRTLAGHGHGYFMRGLGVEQGFDDYRLLPGTFLDPTGVHDVNSERLNRLAKEMLSDPKNVDQKDGRRFFAYYHFLDPHHTYHKHRGHPDFGNQPRDLYDNEVHFTDKWVGDLIDFVLAAPWGDDTAIVITADHGEGFGERGRFRHAYDVWESLVRVPLLIRVPGAAPRRIEIPRGHIDLAPTLLELLGVKAPPGLRGHSLVGEMFGETAAPRPVLVDLPRCDLMDRRRAFVDGKHKLIVFGDEKAFELFDVVADPAEERDLKAEQPALFEAMQQKYRSLAAKIPDVPVVGPGKLLGAPPGQRY